MTYRKVLCNAITYYIVMKSNGTIKNINRRLQYILAINLLSTLLVINLYKKPSRGQ